MTTRFLFFPFAHISKRQLRILFSFFPSFECLPMAMDFDLFPLLAELQGQGKIVPFFLSAETFRAVEQKRKQYLAWAGIHKGNQVNLKLLLKQTPYFTDDSDVTAIRSKIRQGNRVNGKAGIDLPGESSLMQDLLFLKMAQLYDEQNDGIDLALNDLDTIHDQLILNLRGIDPPLPQVENKGSDAGAVMTGERILAWSRCMAAMGGLGRQGADPLLITTSDAVFDYIESNCKDVINALDIDQIKVHENKCNHKDEWHQYFCEHIMGAVIGDGDRKKDLPEVTDNCCLSGQFKLRVFSGNDINRIFNYPGRQISVCLVKLK